MRILDQIRDMSTESHRIKNSFFFLLPKIQQKSKIGPKETDNMPPQIKWSEEQLAIFNWFRGDFNDCNSVVRARAGTGKTTTIFGGVKFASEDRIALLAFNKKNNIEFKAKIAADPELASNRHLQNMTTHGLGYRFLRYYWDVKKLEIDDKLEQRRVVAHLMAVHALRASDEDAIEEKLPSAMVTLVAQVISKLKNIIPLYPKIDEAIELAEKFSLEPDNGWLLAGWTTEKICEIAIDVMKKTSTEKPIRGAAEATISNDDMLWLPLIQNLARPWFNLIVVDEAQDLNRAQMELVKRSLKRGGRFCFVGDDRQAIYKFRGAESDALDNLKAEFNCREFGLTITRRCGKAIVADAQRLVPDYRAAIDAPEGEIINIRGPKLLENARVGDFVVSRKNAPLMAICLGLIKRGVPAKVEGRDVAGSLKTLILRQKSIKTAEALINKLAQWSKRQVEKILKRDPKNDTAIEYVRDQYETIRAVAEECQTISEVIAKIDRIFGETEGSNDATMVTCSSVHKAKGLEADRVFVLMDTLYSKSRTADPIEETNIEYVAITRAKTTLFKVTGQIVTQGPPQ
jgi:superfamily I DNA/RNA helicase